MAKRKKRKLKLVRVLFLIIIIGLILYGVSLILDLKVSNVIVKGNTFYSDWEIIKMADLMVSRAGASTLSEIVALEVPSILIPSPFVANNHQYYNALDLVQKGGAEMIEESSLKDGVLVEAVDKLLKDRDKRWAMKKALRGMQIKESADIIYDKIKELIR